MQDPINNIQWLDARQLQSNDYNPNVVFTPELKLLELSLLSTGWVQPVLVAVDFTIIDGFHRARLAIDSKAMVDRYAYQCPCAVLPVGRPEAMLLTVRMNRAKGSHVAVRMAEMVKELVEIHGVLPETVAKEIGATKDEVTLLLQANVFKQRNLKEYRYSKAWYPIEDRNKAG